MRTTFPVPRSDASWPSVIAGRIVLGSTAIGIVFKLGLKWHFVTDGVTAFALLEVVWELQRQRQRTTARTAAKIGELPNLLRRLKAGSPGAEINTVGAELQRLQTDLVGRATL